MADLKTDYKDDVLDTTQNTKRKYQMIDNEDGTVSFEDVTEYLQQGDSFGADDINDTNEEVNIINDKLSVTDVSSGFYFDTTTVKDTTLKAYRWGNIITVYTVYKPIGNISDSTPFLFSQRYDMASHILGIGTGGEYYIGPVNHKIDVRPKGTRSANTQYYMYFTFITTTA